MSMREKTQDDFDLERFIDMFDTALTSKDERVINALRSLLMIVTLTAPENDRKAENQIGPLRQIFHDMRELNKRVRSLEDTEMKRMYEYDQAKKYKQYPKDYWDDKYTLREEEYYRIAKLFNQPSQLAKKEI